MFLSLEGMLIGLAVVSVAFIVGVAASVMRKAPKRTSPEPRLRRRSAAKTLIIR